MDVDAERERISREIQQLERILDPCCSSLSMDVSESSLDSDSDADSLPDEDSDSDVAGPLLSEEERWGEASNDEDDPKEKALPEDPETCLQLNMVYQEVVREKLAEVSLLLAQNREQQEEIMGDLAGVKGPKVKDGRSPPPNLYLGHFMKPYFRDRVTGVGPPANEDTREKAAQGIKAFEELLVTKWKTWEKVLLRKSVVSDRLQRLLQPKLLKLEYLQQKQSRAASELERQVLEKQAREAEKEVQDINQLPEEALLGDRLDGHDWDKISNVNFEGGRSTQEIRKFWQNYEHPSINKQEWSEQEVAQLKAVAAKHGHLDWQRIAEELGTRRSAFRRPPGWPANPCPALAPQTRRSAFQCLQQYQQHNPALKRKEWTEEEDRILTRLVQAMRIGSHIPYRRIVYYMEGRDSMQLIYRWTKSLDPGLKKGLWAPEEDAKLLQAVAKYGEQDWFKIREEVPGRSDAQCRDRYLRRLHFSLKKGRWNPKEVEKLIELIEKYGVGHWAKIASELPHRSGSQCLSKWKIMVRQRQRQARRRAPRRARWSPSSGSSSDGSWEDSEPEEAPEDAPEEDPAGSPEPLPAPYAVPDMDLWVPTRQSPEELWGAGTGGCPCPPEGPNTATATAPAPAGQLASRGRSTNPRSIRCLCPAIARRWSSEGPPGEERPGSAPWPGPGGGSRDEARPRERPPWAGTVQQRQGHALQWRRLEHKLLAAVSPWVGEAGLLCARPRPAVRPRRADGIRKQLQGAHLASTPVFALFIQLFQIDTPGCVEVVRERKAWPPALLQAGAWDPPPLQEPSSAHSAPGCLTQSVPAQGAAKQGTCPEVGKGMQACRTASTHPAPAPAPCRPRPKPKTVSELLREKRLREARARRAAQGPAILPARVLVSSPVVFQPLAPPAAPVPSAMLSSAMLSGPGGPPVTSFTASGSWAPAKDEQAPTLHAFALGPAASRAPGPVPASCPLSALGQSQVPATSRKQGLPEVPPFLPAAPSPVQLPIQSLSLTPALGTPAAASTSLPVTWVLTAQGLLPVPLQAVMSLPTPTGAPDPTQLSVTLPPSPTETPASRGPGFPEQSHPGPPAASTDSEPELPCRTEPLSESPAEVAEACGLAGLASPGEALAAGETSAPTTPSQETPLAHHPVTGPPSSSPPPLHGAPGAASGPREPRPLDLEEPPLSWLGLGNEALDLSLLSQESEAAAREWLQGQRGVPAPAPGSRLAYQPPMLCSLRALSGLLLRKKDLEHGAAVLAPGGPAGALQASLGRVRERLRDSPAYLLLRARFLAAFALPALLATLSPRGVPTTLSVSTGPDPETDSDQLDPEEPELTDSDGDTGDPAQTRTWIQTREGVPGPLRTRRALGSLAGVDPSREPPGAAHPRHVGVTTAVRLAAGSVAPHAPHSSA
ncbi:snRNA-activating protein complex subunit 4 isoform X2 [Cervus elaphus]|uniref:snRNA-activating protein complex subunit 4 isoform X2 n=1 Tax=Cervus elaphus TaxID=9860 RepID=UPI001CC2E0CA|nr:snRNA-activating protein complex subunit 4 isoform X2 [Cervus elaphus]